VVEGVVDSSVVEGGFPAVDAVVDGSLVVRPAVLSAVVCGVVATVVGFAVVEGGCVFVDASVVEGGLVVAFVVV